MDLEEMKEMRKQIDELMLQVEKILGDIYEDPINEEEDHKLSSIPDELYEYIKENCQTMFMGIS